MGLFKKLTNDGLEQQQDVVAGGSKFAPLDSDVYEAKVKLAYVGKSVGGAMNITFLFEVGDREYRETIYITNKKGENFFTNKDGKKIPLPGFTTVNDICLLTSGNPLSDQDTEEKVVKIWSYEEKAEVPTKVQCLTDVMGNNLLLALQKIEDDKKTKNSDGEYVPTGETVTLNQIAKAMREDKFTVNEIQNEKEEPSYHDKWLNQNQGKTYMKAKGAKAGSNSTGSEEKPAQRKSLFKK